MPFYDDGRLNPEDIKCLEEDGIMLPRQQRSLAKRFLTRSERCAPFRIRTVSAALVSPPPSISSSSTSSTSPASSVSVKFRNFSPGMLSTEIPIRREVKEVLEYIGFKPEAAEDISQRWNLESEGPWEPMETAHDLVDKLESPRYAGLKLRDAMSRVGLKDEVAAPILDPEFRDLLETQGLCFWIKDTLDTNYHTLLYRQRLLKRHANKVMAQKDRRERDGLENTSQQGEQSSATINLTMEDFKLPAAHVSVIEGDPQPVLPDHVVLYRGIAYCNHWPSEEIVKNDGSIQLHCVHDRRYRGDFNADGGGFYWAEEKETAERYRKWAALRCPASDTCIIQIQVRRTFLDQLWMFDWPAYVRLSAEVRGKVHFDFFAATKLAAE
ncbi:hypothetical protein N8T08_001900 [Aspergillus melleus]|uniref:Uncharacterized protein n=1 Tax=Aspergillus melleus TaxID=138277 RepID=A0ACC3B9Q7_9EURO|nr:hypothetical protein N8T08_001900 [Aspergillus melleus]